jgi:hypothetical protein
MNVLARFSRALPPGHGAVFAHPMKGVRVAGEFVPDLVPTEADLGYVERILAAYDLALSKAPASRPEDIWTAIGTRQRSFFDVLESGDHQRLAGYLCNMSRHDATQGTSQGAQEYQRLRRSGQYRRFVARMTKDKLLSLAEAVGAVACENPEQGEWGQSVLLDPGELALRVSSIVGADIAPPMIDGGLFKISAGSDWFGERDCNAIYTGWIMTRQLGPHGSAVCEIGAGAGRVAYWAVRFGVEDYTIYDLPHVNVLQAFYLMKALGRDAVRLYGEADLPGVVSILPDFACEEDRRHYDLVLNQDSFPEIDADVVRAYLRWTTRVTRWLLSINQESRPPSSSTRGTREWTRKVARSLVSRNQHERPDLGDDGRQNNVSDLIRESGGFGLRSRQLYWLRKGYVMELYEVLE